MTKKSMTGGHRSLNRNSQNLSVGLCKTMQSTKRYCCTTYEMLVFHIHLVCFVPNWHNLLDINRAYIIDILRNNRIPLNNV